jgi:hypothetical protein
MRNRDGPSSVPASFVSHCAFRSPRAPSRATGEPWPVPAASRTSATSRRDPESFHLHSSPHSGVILNEVKDLLFLFCSRTARLAGCRILAPQKGRSVRRVAPVVTTSHQPLVACRRESITAVATPKNKKQVCAWRVQLFGRIFSPFHTNEFTATGH